MLDEMHAVLPAMMEARNRFMQLVDELRPELHRYCARMTGSVFDGEDVLQDTLAKAYYALGQMLEPPNLKPWLFRIAHNTAMDFLKRSERKNVDLVPDVPERAEPEERGVDPGTCGNRAHGFRRTAAGAASARSSLRTSLGSTLDEVAATMGTTVGAVKAALSRGRRNIARTSHEGRTPPVPPPSVGAASDAAALCGSLQRSQLGRTTRAAWRGIAARSRLSSTAACRRRAVLRSLCRAPQDRRHPGRGGLCRRRSCHCDVQPGIEPHRLCTSSCWSRAGGRISLIRDFRYIRYIAADARFSKAV